MVKKHTTRNPYGAIAPNGRTLQIVQATPAIQTLLGNHWRCWVENRRKIRGKDTVSKSFPHEAGTLDELLQWIMENWAYLKINALHCAEDIEHDDLETIRTTLRPVFKKHRRVEADPLGIRAGLRSAAAQQRSKRQ